jgi:hypothetical protein
MSLRTIISRRSGCVQQEPVCGPAFMRDFASACRSMVPLVKFATKALGLRF